MKKWAAMLLLAVLLVFVFRKSLRRHLFGGAVAVLCDGEQSRDLSTMDPRLSKKVLPILEFLRKAGFDFQVSSVYRSPDRQQCLYDISDALKQVTGCCAPMSAAECSAAGLGKTSCAVLTEGGCTARYKLQNRLRKSSGMTFPRGRFFGVIPCVIGVTSTDKSCHNNVRGGEPSALAIDLHIYGVSEERKVEFYKLLRSKARKSKLKSGGDFPKSNAYWAKHDLGWDPGHVQLLNCKSKLRLK